MSSSRAYDKAVIILTECGLLTPENRQILTDKADEIWFSLSLNLTYKAGILTQENLIALSEKGLSPEFLETLCILAEQKILTKKTFAALNTNFPFVRILHHGTKHLVKAMILTEDNFILLSEKANSTSMTNILSILNESHLLTQDNFTALVKQARYVRLLDAFHFLNSKKYLTQDSFNLVISHPEQAQELSAGLSYLIRKDISISAPIINNALANHAPHAITFAHGLIALKEEKMLNEDHIAMLSLNPEQAHPAAIALIILKSAALLTIENLALLKKDIQHIANLSSGFINLKNGRILNQASFSALMEKPEHSEKLSTGLARLSTSKLLSLENHAFLLLHAEQADALADALVALHIAGILTSENRGLIAKAPLVSAGLRTLILSDKALLTQDNFKILVKYAQYAVSLADSFVILNSAGLFTLENRDLLCKQERHLPKLLEGLQYLQNKILTQDVFLTLIDKATSADKLVSGFYTLGYYSILNRDTFFLLSSNIQHIDELIIGLDFLNSATLLTSANITLLSKDPSHAREIAWRLCTLHEAKIDVSDPKIHLYETIYTDDTGKFDFPQKVAAFFLDYRDALIETPSSSKINKALSKINPESLRKDIKSILNKMGGYSFMREGACVTLGVEIEYSNIPMKHKELTETVMDIIQSGWCHPGDESVYEIGKDTYSGEATTPIISNNTELKLAMLNVAFLKAMGAQTNESCGMHIHVGVVNLKTPMEFQPIDKKNLNIPGRPYTTYQFEFMKQFAIIYKREEQKFKQIERENSYYARAIDPSGIEKIEELSQLIAKFNPGESRYFELNLHAFNIIGTVELRRFAGTTDESAIFAMMAMVAAMAEEAKARTNLVFAHKLQAAGLEEKHEIKDSHSETLSSPALSAFFKRQQTEQRRELFTLRVKPIQQSALSTDPANSKKEHNTIYLSLDEKGNLAYEVITQEEKSITGHFDASEKFQPIINKLTEKKKLDKADEITILQELSNRGLANISGRVEKLKSPALEKISQPGRLSEDQKTNTNRKPKR